MMARPQRPRQSCATSHRLAPSWSMRTMPSMAKSEGNMEPAARTGLGIASRGQEKPARKNCGRLVPRTMSVGVSGRLNQAPSAWPMKLVARMKTAASAKQLQRVAEHGKAVEARQHEEVERERGQIDGQVRDAAAEHARERSAGGLRQGDDGQHRGADQQHLLQDQHEGRRHDVARVAADRVEDRLQQDVGGARGRQRRLGQAAVGARAARGELRRQRIDRKRDAGSTLF